MTDNPNEITVDNSVLILIRPSAMVAFAVNSIDPSLLSNNLEGLASSAKALDVAVILTTVGAEGGKLRDPLMRAVADVFPDRTPIDRTSTNAWADIREAVEATGRKTLLMAGLWTEVCLAQTAISALAHGYRVFFVSDCSGGLTVESHEDAKRRLVQAGATPINWVGVVCEWAPDFTSDERHKVNPAVMKSGAGVGLALEQAFAQNWTDAESCAEHERRRKQMEKPIDLVSRFCAAWANDLGAEDLAAFFTDNAVYHNIPFEPITGRQNIADNIASFIRPGPPGIERIEFRVINIAANGPVVMTERVDVFTLAGKTFDLQVMGAFEVNDGKINAWRDYFDPSQFNSQTR